jgi:hypothetical protein
MESLITFVTISLVLVSCNNQNTIAYQPTRNVEQIKPISQKGKKLIEQKYYICNSPNTSMTERLAPPMVTVKSHYMTDDITKEAFTDEKSRKTFYQPKRMA